MFNLFSDLNILNSRNNYFKDEIDIPKNYFWNIPTLMYAKDSEGKPLEVFKFSAQDESYQRLILDSLEEFNDLFNVRDIQCYLNGEYALSCIDMDKYIDSIGRDILYTAIDCLTTDSRYKQLMKDLLSVDSYNYCGRTRNIKTNVIKGCELIDRISYMALDIYITNLSKTFLDILRFGNKLLFISNKDDFHDNLDKAIRLADQFGMCIDFDNFKVNMSCRKLTFSGFILDNKSIVMNNTTVSRIKSRIKYLFRTYSCEEAVVKVYKYLFKSKTVNGQFTIENYFFNLTDSYQLNDLDLFIKDCILKSFSGSNFKLTNFVGLEDLFTMYKEDRFYMVSVINRLTHLRPEGIITARRFKDSLEFDNNVDFYKAFVESIGKDDCYFVYNDMCIKSCYMTFNFVDKTISFNGRVIVKDNAVTVNLFYFNKEIYKVNKSMQVVPMRYKILGKLYSESAFNVASIDDNKPNPNRYLFVELTLNYLLERINIPKKVISVQQRFRLSRFLIELFTVIVTNRYTIDTDFVAICYKDIHLILEKPYFYKEVL